MERREFMASLVAGGCAGMCVDLTLFPLDTIKTRLQSQQGFYKAGGFRGIYAGVPSAAVGSFPNAAAFFVTYEYTKALLGTGGVFALPHVAPVTHMLAASLGEVVACLIRVPTEVVKQRAQASLSSSTYNILLATLREEGVRGLYRGYGSTVLREVDPILSGSVSALGIFKVKGLLSPGHLDTSVGGEMNCWNLDRSSPLEPFLSSNGRLAKKTDENKNPKNNCLQASKFLLLFLQ
ncbi:S-adenosylmethionine mitochondrial carrier protein isoform X3 [Neolamprologus brichardi]|uniref:S-adenosylmethionine mitochondrial carrier protein isoform X3 n=1 Tax=Neolamprologus brichardi TaxID=32507 RepID=UPI001643D547|nr:S-adenosylmethionine mitochondrial carrier protein isoform X3 [Neolamprologus brichardi]